ncbi:MAG TPA: hypothetical protein PKA58_20230 [Polyangium sp.]|nr:hypothetical protein [Polyangium sp.]
MDFSIAGLWREMGLFARMIVIVLGIMSITSLVVVGERLVVALQSAGQSRNFAAKLASILTKEDIDEMHDLGIPEPVIHSTLDASLPVIMDKEMEASPDA